MRTSIRRLTRLANALSKSPADDRHAITPFRAQGTGCDAVPAAYGRDANRISRLRRSGRRCLRGRSGRGRACRIGGSDRRRRCPGGCDRCGCRLRSTSSARSATAGRPRPRKQKQTQPQSIAAQRRRCRRHGRPGGRCPGCNPHLRSRLNLSARTGGDLNNAAGRSGAPAHHDAFAVLTSESGHPTQ